MLVAILVYWTAYLVLKVRQRSLDYFGFNEAYKPIETICAGMCCAILLTLMQKCTYWPLALYGDNKRPNQNNKYALTHFHIRFLFEANLHKVKRMDNIYRMFQDSVYINCLQYQFYSDNILKFTVRSLDSLISLFREHILWPSLFAFPWHFWVCNID